MKKFFALGLLVAILSFGWPTPVDAATIFLTASSGSVTVGSSFTVSVRTNTQGEATNTAEARITYSTDTLELISVKQGTTFYLPAPGSPGQSAGSAYFGGGVPTPGYTGGSGSIGTLTFRARAEGIGTISVSSGKVLLNDGLGTNALTGSSGATVRITAPAVGAPTVSSTTHPNPAGWSSAKTVDLTWTRPGGAFGFSYELDQKADTVPDSTLDTTVTTQKTYENLADGVYYFHIRARAEDAGRGFGPTVHFRIGIDTVKPEPFQIVVEGDGSEAALKNPTISFVTTDSGSGMAGYNVLVDGEMVKEQAESPYTLENLSGGKHVIQVVAVDNAGNQQTAELEVVVAGPTQAGFWTRLVCIPLYLILLSNFIYFLILFLLLLLLLKRRKRKSIEGSSEDINEMQKDIDESLEALKQQITSKLLAISAKSSEELFDKETAVAKDLRINIGKTRKQIDSKIERISKKRKTKVSDE